MVGLFHDQNCFFFNLFHCIFFICYFVYYSDHISKVTYSNSLFKFKISYRIFLFLWNIYFFNRWLCYFCCAHHRCISLPTLLLILLNHLQLIFHTFKHWLPWWFHVLSNLTECWSLIFHHLAKSLGAYYTLCWASVCVLDYKVFVTLAVSTLACSGTVFGLGSFNWHSTTFEVWSFSKGWGFALYLWWFLNRYLNICLNNGRYYASTLIRSTVLIKCIRFHICVSYMRHLLNLL